MQILDGKNTAKKIRQELKGEIERRKSEDSSFNLTLSVILVGNDPASEVYVNNKIKACANVGITSLLVRFVNGVSEDEIIEKIEELNEDASVDGILLQLPLPKGYDEDKIINRIHPSKDVDGLTIVQQGRLYSGADGLVPCTPSGVIRLMKEYGIEFKGKNAVVIGRSILVGKPLFNLLLNENATVTICHSRTANLVEHTKQADIICVAVGKPRMLTEDMVKENVVVVDIGINRTSEGLVGDVDFENVSKKASFITPVPGGVGPMTIATLLTNTLKAHDLRVNKK